MEENYTLVDKRSDRHFVLRDKITSEFYFVKTLRSNGMERTKELIPEFFTEKIFSLIGISNLQPQLGIYQGKPAIWMRYFPDLRNPIPIRLTEVNIDGRDYFATALFIIDRFVKNTNRIRGKPEHIGWEDLGNKVIRFHPLDNGHSLGHGDENMENDNDLINPAFTDRFSSEIIPTLTPEFVDRVITRLSALNFELVGQEIEKTICEKLLPTNEEQQFISTRIARAVTMLNRRRPLVTTMIKQLVGIDTSTSAQMPIGAETKVVQ